MLRAYLAAEIPVSLGTDSPVVPYDPGRGGGAGLGGESASGPELGYGGVRVSDLSEDERGTLKVGELADLAVRPRNT